MEANPDDWDELADDWSDDSFQSELGNIQPHDENDPDNKLNNGSDADDKDDIHLKKIVLLAYTDLTAAGSRALLGIDMRIEYHTLYIPQLADAKPASVRDHKPEPTQQNFQPVQILHCKYEEFSLIIVNTILPGSKCHYVADNILDLCIKSNVSRVILFTSLHLDVPKKKLLPMYENYFNTKPITESQALPDDVLIIDPFLSTWLQLIQIVALPLNCLIVPGYKAVMQQANSDDGSKQAIAIFQDTLQTMYGLQFSRERSLTLLYKAKNLPEEDMATMIYA